MDYFDDNFDESIESDNIYEIEEVVDESPQGGLVLQVLDYRGKVEDIIIGLDNIKTYINSIVQPE